MKLLETKDGILYFVFDHNSAYQAVERKFLDAVESLHPDNIVVCFWFIIPALTVFFLEKSFMKLSF